MQDNGWDHALKVTGDGAGLVGHAGAVLLRKAADQAGLTAGLSAALARAGKSPLRQAEGRGEERPDGREEPRGRGTASRMPGGGGCSDRPVVVPPRVTYG